MIAQPNGILSGLLLMTGLLTASVAADTIPLTSELIVSGLNSPTFVASPRGDADRLFVVEQGGRIRIVRDGAVLTQPFLDLSSQVPDETWNGMLGLCFDPDYDTNGQFYVQHTLGGASSNRVSIARYNVSSNPDVADANSRHTILELSYPQGQAYHVGGWIGFGPDGMLTILMGDGSTNGDNAGGSRAQSLNSHFGKVLRVDVDGPDAYPADPNRNFAIPTDNPFIGSGLGEIFALGLRNPYRGDHDDITGDLWIADVGQYMNEEIDLIMAGTSGQNFGWNCAEGTWCMPNGNCGCETSLSAPAWEYGHALGCSISGGSVYDGCTMPSMQGRYFFSDWCSARVWSCRSSNGDAIDVINHTTELNDNGQSQITSVTAIGADGLGELIIVSQTGRLYRVVAADGSGGCGTLGDLDGDGIVGVDDLLALLNAWGPCPFPGPCEADLNGDGMVGVDDVLILLAAWTV